MTFALSYWLSTEILLAYRFQIRSKASSQVFLRHIFLDFGIFNFFPLFGLFKNQSDLVVFFAMMAQTCPMEKSFNQLPIAVQVWNLVQSIFKRISRTFFFNHELRIFSHFLDFSKITFNFYDCDPNLPLPIDSEFKHPSVYWYSAL